MNLYDDILKNYQRDGVDFLEPRHGGLVFDEMGLGKTLTTLTTVFRNKKYPVLIVCPKFALGVWQNELEKWQDEKSIIYTGTPKEREKLWSEFITSDCKFLITNYEMQAEIGIRSGIAVKTLRTAINQPGTFKWGSIIWDEVHDAGILNHKTATYKISAKLAKDIPDKYVLTGTPVKKGCVDLFGPLSLVDPKRFKSYWSFVNTWCVITTTPFGKEIEPNPRDLVAFRKMLSQYMIRRLKKEVDNELPAKIRQPLIVNMNKKQEKVYKELTEELIATVPDGGELLITPGTLPLMIRQRQILACPQELGFKERGAAIDAIIEHSHLSLDNGKPVAVFTPFRRAIPWCEEAFRSEYSDVRIYKIQGQMTADEFRDSWTGFQNDKYPRKVLLCVIKSGASFTATACSTGYFLGYEWDFTLNEQAEDRLYRMGQSETVNIFYVIHKGTIDEVVLDKLNQKKTCSNLIVGSEKQFLEAIGRRK